MKLMDRYIFGRNMKRLLRLHYDIRVTGEELLRDGKIHLVMPNHTAYIDPLVLFSQEWWLPIRPMSDELFMRHWLYGRVLRMADAIEVPDLYKSAMTREEGVAAAAKLSPASAYARVERTAWTADRNNHQVRPSAKCPKHGKPIC